jgi:AcrR family transcriptional regulator
MADIGIKERVLDVAERLFAENGLKETSVRDITAAAGVHLAAVNYHFGSKEELIRAVIARRAAPLNRQRLELLEAYEAEAGDTPVPLERILHAFFAPSIKLCLHHPDIMRLAARLLFEPDEELRRAFLSHFVDVFLCFKSALMRHALPELPERELFWRMHFLIGAMIHTWANHSDLEWVSGGLCTLENEQDMMERLITFCAAGLRAPISARLGVTV